MSTGSFIAAVAECRDRGLARIASRLTVIRSGSERIGAGAAGFLATCFWILGPGGAGLATAGAETGGSAGIVLNGVIHVAPGGAGGPGDGTRDHPFVLKRGGEYDLNRIVRTRSASDGDVTVIFHDGIYRDVQLKIIRQGIDSDSVYADDPLAPSRCDKASGSTCRCNAQGMNCRVLDQDYTLDARQDTRLTLVADHPGAAIFDGRGLSDLSGLSDATAMTIGGSRFGVVPSEVARLESRPMSNVVVDGLAFRNYRNGIAVDFATDVTIRRCTVSDMGSGPSARLKHNDYGAFAVGINGNSARILFTRNVIRNARDAAAGDGSDPTLPSLMHGIYLQNSRDVLFLRNQFLGSSGPMIKFMQYPGDDHHPAFPAGAGHRRTFFVDNLFVLQTVFEQGVALPVFAGQQGFVEDNAVVEVSGATTKPTAGAVFINNTFRNDLPTSETQGEVSLLRQEIVPGLSAPTFPGWLVLGSTITGVDRQHLVVARYRGKALNVDSIVVEPEVATEIDGLLDDEAVLPPGKFEAVLQSIIRNDTDLDRADNDAAHAFIRRAFTSG